ncbi:gap junction delta-4 protein [Genypterus blacodes]|uniref:gap junction delta-4 protein n=1 Tax=Genypterus blacodes TaxID=154954 RepID=UPI003F771F04
MALIIAGMAAPSASEVIFISVNHSITLMGKVWLIVMVFLRVLVLLLAGFPLYQDEQERFVCNTIQPGCANMCYDLFSPVSLFRFWLVQLITLCLPYIIFVVYVIHKVCSGLALDLDSSGGVRAKMLYKICQEQNVKTGSSKKLPVAAERGGAARCFTGAYILHLVFRMLLEAGFGAAHYYLFGFYIPRRFLCQHPPCTTQVDCYVSRPTEKTVLLIFMLGVGALSLLLNVLDFICAIKRSVRQKMKRKMMEKVMEEEQYYLSSKEDPKGAEAGNGGSFRKRRGSKGSSVEGASASGQESSSPPRPPASLPSGSSRSNTNGNNGYSLSQEEVPERAGSEVALCPAEPLGTPRSIRVSKRNRIKPPPPPRRDLGSAPETPAGPAGEVPAATGVCARRLGQYTLVELTGEDKEEKRSEWV